MMHLNNIYIEGKSSGLGKYLREEFDTPDVPDRTIVHRAIISCAWPYLLNDLYQYSCDSINRTYNAFSYHAHKYIFISTIDVYPKNNNIHFDDEFINPKNITGIYGINKFVMEQFTKTKNNYLIIRPSALLGKYTGNNNISKLSRGEDIDISLNSEFNFITYEQVKNFIAIALQENLTGIYNLVGKGNVKLKRLNNNVQDGNYVYKSGKFSTQKLEEVMEVRSSLDNYKYWLDNSLVLNEK